MKNRLFILLFALIIVMAASVNAFAYTCVYGDVDSDEHITNWLSAWISDPANADLVKAVIAEAKDDLIKVYGCSPDDKYPADYFDSEAEYLNTYCWFAAMEEYYEHEALDLRIINCEAYGINHEDINIFINDAFLHYDDVAPIIKDSRTMVPFRLIFNALGMQVNYDNNTKTVTAADAGKQIAFTLGSDILTVIENGNKKEIKMDVLPYAENGRTFVPVRFISEAYGWDVYWDAGNKAVIILDRQSYIDALNTGFEEMNAIAANEELNQSFVNAMAAYRSSFSGKNVKHYAGTMLMDIIAAEGTIKTESNIDLYSEGSDRLLYDIMMNVSFSDMEGTVSETERSRIYADLLNGNKYTYSGLESEAAGVEELWLKEAYDASPYDALTMIAAEEQGIGLDMSREIFMITTLGQDIYKNVIGSGNIDVFTFRDMLRAEYEANFALFNNESVSLDGKTINIDASLENMQKAASDIGYVFSAADEATYGIKMSVSIAEDDSSWGYSFSVPDDDTVMLMAAEYGAEKISYFIEAKDNAMQMKIDMQLSLQEETEIFPKVFSENAIIME